MPSVGHLKARKANPKNTMLLGGKKASESFPQAISQYLDRGSWHVFALPLESLFQLILAEEGAILFIVCLDRLKHRVIDHACLAQALHEQLGLFLLQEKAILKRFHVLILPKIVRMVKRGMHACGAFSPHLTLIVRFMLT